MRSNKMFANSAQTHEGAISTAKLTDAQQLRRTVMACMLFEDSFYESGVNAAQRIRELTAKVSFPDAAKIAIDARERMKLRHVPLLVVREMLRVHKGRQMGDLIARVIQRPDELMELLAIYWSDGEDQPLTAQMKIGLARALKKFSEYQLAKWNQDGKVKLRDVLFLSHARSNTEEQAALLKRIADNALVTPDTWEVSLSGGADKAATFSRLMADNKLGALALLRNLRGMIEAKVPEDEIRSALSRMTAERVLPFRFITAAKYAPRMEDALESAMFRCLAKIEPMAGKTALLIDHSASMGAPISQKSEITRFQSAAALAMVMREVCERVRVFTFSDRTVEVPPRRGFALRQAIEAVVNPVGTLLGAAVRNVYRDYPECNRIIVITDEQSADRPTDPQGHGYIINVAGYQNGIGYGPWVTIDGWSEAVLDYIKENESNG